MGGGGCKGFGKNVHNDYDITYVWTSGYQDKIHFHRLIRYKLWRFLLIQDVLSLFPLIHMYRKLYLEL